MRKVRLLMVFALCAVWPTGAFAQSDFIDWLQQQSGPGPYKNSSLFAYEVRIWCLPKADEALNADPTAQARELTALRKVRSCLADDPNRTRSALSIGGTFTSTGNSRLFLDDPIDVREVHEKVFSFAYVHRINPVIDLGGALSLLRFSGDQGVGGSAFTFWRFGLGPRIVLIPWGACNVPSRRVSALARVIGLQFDGTWVPQTFTARDYGNTVSKFDAGPEFQVRASLVVNAGVLVQALWP
jgi:hypothetical protein